MITPDWHYHFPPTGPDGKRTPEKLAELMGTYRLVHKHRQWTLRSSDGFSAKLKKTLENHGADDYSDQLLFNDQATLDEFLVEDTDDNLNALRRAIRKRRAYPDQRSVLTLTELGRVFNHPSWWPQEFPARSPVKNFVQLMDARVNWDTESKLHGALGHLGTPSNLGDKDPIRSLWSDMTLARVMKLQHLAEESTFHQHSVHITLGTMATKKLQLSREAILVASDVEEILILPDPEFQETPSTIMFRLGRSMGKDQYSYYAQAHTHDKPEKLITGSLMPVPAELGPVFWPTPSFLNAYAASQSISKPMASRVIPLDVLAAVEGI